MTTARLEAQAIQQGLDTKIVGRRVVSVLKTSSTMDLARREAEAGAIEGTVVLAEEQTAGRGRFQRRWVSPAGLNLYFSVVLRPALHELRRMNMAATLAVVRAIQAAAGLEPTVKWPNDVRLSGKKVSGILIEDLIQEERVRYAIVGIGLNVNLDPTLYHEIADIATSLMKERGEPVSRLLVLRALLREMDGLYVKLRRGESLLEEWTACLETLNRHVRVHGGGRDEEGVATGVDEEGNLLLRRPDGSIVTVIAGEVTLQV